MGRKVINFPSCYHGSLFEHADGTPRLWWVHEPYWQEREYITTRERPVEDAALLHIWLASRALQRLDVYRWSLTKIEANTLALELRCFRENKHYSAGMRYEWIAGHMGREWTPRQIKGILDDVSDVLRRAEMARVLEIIEGAEKRKTQYFREVVREAIREQCEQLDKVA